MEDSNEHLSGEELLQKHKAERKELQGLNVLIFRELWNIRIILLYFVTKTGDEPIKM